MTYRLTSTAEDQIDALLLDSARTNGLVAAGRYGILLLTVMAALGTEPQIVGSVEIPRLKYIRAFPIRLARQRVESSHRVATPRHLVVYRIAADGVVEILGVVHDRMVLSRAARRLLRESDRP